MPSFGRISVSVVTAGNGTDHEGMAMHCGEHLGVATHLDELLVVAVVPRSVGDRLRLGTISPA